MTFGKLIRALCRAEGISNAELARRIGVSQPRIQQILASRSISEDTLRRCFKALGYKFTLLPKKS